MSKMELSAEQKAFLEETEMGLVEVTRVVALLDEAGMDVETYKVRLDEVRKPQKFLKEK